MRILHTRKKSFRILLVLAVLLASFLCSEKDVYATGFPTITVDFDPNDQSVIVSGIPSYDATGAIIYELHGYLNYGDTRVETFSYAPSAVPYHVPDKQAYIFNWSDAEFLLPCSGDYKFTAYVVAVKPSPSSVTEEKGPKTTIDITLTKKDESTNWGPGLPNTTVESYNLNQIKGSDKTIRIEELDYIWTINGTDIENVPEKNISLAIISNSENFPSQGVDEFFGDTAVAKLSIDHEGEFGFKATLDYLVGTQYAGKYASLFHAEGDGSFLFLESVLVAENGQASFTLLHASDYVIAITDVPYTGQELNPKPEETVTETETDVKPTVDAEIAATEDTNHTDSQVTESNGSAFSTYLIIIGFAPIIAAVIIFIRKKHNS